MVSKGTSAPRLSRYQCSRLTHLHRDAERRGSAVSRPLCIPAVRAAASPPPPPSEQTERKGRRTGPGDSTEAKSPHKATRWSAFPVAWSKLLTEQRQGTGKKSTLVNGKHYSPLIPQTHLMTFLGPWGLLFYPSLNHRVLVKLFYYKIHQMLSNKDEQ